MARCKRKGAAFLGIMAVGTGGWFFDPDGGMKFD